MLISELTYKPSDFSGRCSIKRFTEINKRSTFLIVNSNNHLTILFFIFFLVQGISFSRISSTVYAFSICIVYTFSSLIAETKKRPVLLQVAV